LSRYEGLREKAENACMASMLTPRIAERKCLNSLKVGSSTYEAIAFTTLHDVSSLAARMFKFTSE
jgi:hypothetical protein